nr:hypothetical protein L203_00118 [Cryptococcus depauperatus CBS 7841]
MFRVKNSEEWQLYRGFLISFRPERLEQLPDIMRSILEELPK